MATMIPWLDTDASFPPLESAMTEPNGLLCAGGNLAAQTLLSAYSLGIYPWYSEGQPILWWSPDPRMVLLPADLKISASLAKTLRKDKFTVRFDSAFIDVITACAAPREINGTTWILPEMIAAYVDLHKRGVAHSAECWLDNELVGGLYGIAIGKVFFGESMFTRVTDASKVAFATLMQKLLADGFELIDCQQYTRHLARFGAKPITRIDFTHRLRELINYPALQLSMPPPCHWKIT